MAAAEHSENSDFLEVDNVIYEATVTTTSAQEKDPRLKIRPPDTRRNKRVGVGVGLLVAVLVLLNVAIPLYLHQSYTVEREQLMNSYNQVLAKNNNLTEELAKTNNLTDQLAKTNNLIKERDQLQREMDSMRRMLCETSGWLPFDRGLYYISTEMKSWDESRQWCRARQSDLIVINSKEKQDFVASFNKRVWLGLTDTEREGSFQWVDGTPLTTPTYWVPGTPDNREPTTNEEKDCAEYYYGDDQSGFPVKGWNDIPCSASKNWICERVLC